MKKEKQKTHVKNLTIWQVVHQICIPWVLSWWPKLLMTMFGYTTVYCVAKDMNLPQQRFSLFSSFPLWNIIQGTFDEASNGIAKRSYTHNGIWEMRKNAIFFCFSMRFFFTIYSVGVRIIFTLEWTN